MAHRSLTLNAGAPEMKSMVGMADESAQDREHAYASSAASDDSSQDDDCEREGSHARSGCSTCANCCLGAYAPPPVVVLTLVQAAADVALQFPPSPFTGHIPARIERPPRTVAPVPA